MSVLVTDSGMVLDDWQGGFALLEDRVPSGGAVDVPLAALDPARHAALIAALPGLAMIRVRLAHFGDTGALALARDLRARGYRGRLRAQGAVLARGYTLLRRAGFDEVELDNTQARLQPPEHWHNQTDWQPHRPEAGARP